MDFDRTGDYLATGDKGGRIVLFERNATVSVAKLIGLFYAGNLLDLILCVPICKTEI